MIFFITGLLASETTAQLVCLICNDFTMTGWWFGTWLLFFHILGIIVPTDELIFFRGVGQPPTTWCFLVTSHGLFNLRRWIANGSNPRHFQARIASTSLYHITFPYGKCPTFCKSDWWNIMTYWSKKSCTTLDGRTPVYKQWDVYHCFQLVQDFATINSTINPESFWIFLGILTMRLLSVFVTLCGSTAGVVGFR